MYDIEFQVFLNSLEEFIPEKTLRVGQEVVGTYTMMDRSQAIETTCSKKEFCTPLMPNV